MGWLSRLFASSPAPELESSEEMVAKAVADFRALESAEIDALAKSATGDAAMVLQRYSTLDGMGYQSAASVISKATGIKPQRVIVDVLRRYVPIAQSRAKLALYKANGMVLYDITTASDDLVCTCCRQAALSGPYRIDNPTAIPGLLGCTNCRCSIAPFID